MIHRKEYEMAQLKAQHTSTTDPIRMAMGYAQESLPRMRLAKALRRVYDDDSKDNNNNSQSSSSSPSSRQEQMTGIGLSDLGMRRPSFVVDIKRKSPSSSSSSSSLCQFDDAGQVAQAMVQLGADVVLINTDYPSYGGDSTELQSAVKAVRKVSQTAAVVMKDIVVDEFQLGMAKHAGADGIVLMASVLGPALDNFVNLATCMGLETLIECHTKNEVEYALNTCLATNIIVNNYDRVRQEYHPEQAIQLAGLFPGSGGPIVCLASGGLATTDDMKRHLAAGYDGVIVGKAVMGSPNAPALIRAVKDRTLLPSELAKWGEHAEFDKDGNLMPGPKQNIPSDDDLDVYQ